MEEINCDILIGVAQRGGVENVINETASYLQKNGFRIRIIQFVWEGYYWVKPELEFYPIYKEKAGHTLDEFVISYQMFLEEKGAPDIVLAVAWPYMSYIAKSVCKMLDQNFKVYSWLHAPVEQYQRAGYGGYGALEFADEHLAISSQIATQIVKNLGYDVVVRRINNPIDFSKCREIRKSLLTHQLMYVGRISVEKRLDVLIRALEQTAICWKLHIIGDGDVALVQEYKELAKSLGVDGQIVWHGWNDNPWTLGIQADALVMASEYEGFPLVALEAMACGIPVISTPVSGIADLIIPGKNGYLYPVGEGKSLAKILGLMDKEVLPIITGKDCRESIIPYEKENAAKHILNILDNL